ncbi:Guanyl-nucleotide exchange factor [Gigaspora margarita]|uniref:Guanyl-nucleotide exchange factor n=1 Tax=Gigaspora margarita TaxID=4874 RepID=A0A8H3X8D8_GIGMA|nr:Guanyl-nucleotide exchange factor [Gigaspora margarita]
MLTEESTSNGLTPGSTVEDVVKQHNLGRKPSPQQDLQFDFNRFLQQMANPNATNIARYVKSFEREFEKKPWPANDQIKIIHDFLDFISIKMRDCELWRNASDAEFENAKEGMEKLVMNRLYKLTFSPAIKGPVTTDDRERDEILQQKIQIFRWVKEEHLDITHADHNEQYFEFAKNELLKINFFKAPRDKLICILNCCKVIFGLIRHVDGEESADKFLPILIFVVLKANPDNLMGAISFIENMDASSLSISREDFEANIEKTVKELDRELPKLQENNREISYDNVMHPSKNPLHVRTPILNPAQAKALFEKGSILAQKTIQKPLNIVGRIFAEISNDFSEFNDPLSSRQVNNSSSDANSASGSSSLSTSPQKSSHIDSLNGSPRRLSDSDGSQHLASPNYTRDSTDFSDVQAEVARVSEAEFQYSLSTLRAMFPNIDPDICEVVLQNNEWSIARAIDQLLELSDPTVVNNSNLDDLYMNVRTRNIAGETNLENHHQRNGHDEEKSEI